jgi:hypothetical protein
MRLMLTTLADPLFRKAADEFAHPVIEAASSTGAKAAMPSASETSRQSSSAASGVLKLANAFLE